MGLDTDKEPRRYVLALAVAVVAAAVFSTALNGPWLYDDRPLIADNAYIQSFHWWPRWWTTDFWQINEELVRYGSRMVYWRPGITSSYALDWALGGGAPVMFHITNTLAQGVVGGLGFVVLRRWIGSTWPAFAAALLFAVHPTKAESVAWIAGRTDVYCMIGIFLATTGVARRLRGARGGIALEVLGTVIAYTTKEQAIVIPAFVAVEIWVAADRPPIDRAMLVKIARGVWPQTLLTAVYFAGRAVLMPIHAANLDATTLSLADHAQAILESIGRFTALTFAPYDLSIQQALVHYAADRSLVHSTPYVILGALVLAGAAVLIWKARRRWPWVAVGVAFYLATLAPTANIIYTQMATLISERFLYLPVLGLALVAGGLLARVPQQRRVVAYAAVAVVIAALSIQSLRRSADYTDEHGFWTRELAMHDDSQEAYAVLLHEAVDAKHYVRALELLDALNDLSNRQVSSGLALLPGAELERAFQVALIVGRLTPDNDVVALRAIDGYAADLLAANEAHLATKVLTLTYPKRSSTEKLLDSKGFRGRLLAVRAELHNRIGDDALAVQFAREALATCERCPNVASSSALALARAGRYVEALEIYDHLEVGTNQTKTREVIERALAVHDQAASATGPRALQLRASELATLELWGRAYAVLAPHVEDIKHAPRFALGFAELAYRAGETAVARDVLAASPPPDGIDATLAEWAVAMGWQP